MKKNKVKKRVKKKPGINKNAGKKAVMAYSAVLAGYISFMPCAAECK